MAVSSSTAHDPVEEAAERRQKVLRRLLGGTVGGVLQAATSHPFDTVKSRVQRSVYPDLTTCVRATWKNEGLRGFYRGVTPPLFLGGVYNSILFSINQWMMNVVTPADHPHGTSLPLWRTALAGQLTAPVYVLAITPMEVVKVRLQVQNVGDGCRAVHGPIGCARAIYSTRGVMGFLDGYVPTVMSRIIGLPFYFAAYQTTQDTLRGTSIAQSPVAGLLLPIAGGVMAGFCFWCSNYPFDFLKTQLQASSEKLSMRQVARAVYNEKGIRGFYRGFSACLLRSVPANSTVWVGVELTTKFLRENGM